MLNKVLKTVHPRQIFKHFEKIVLSYFKFVQDYRTNLHYDSICCDHISLKHVINVIQHRYVSQLWDVSLIRF